MVKYRYGNLPIPGGGYVTGFVYDGKEKGTLYLRTDIGGIYRFAEDEERWIPLNDDVNMDDIRATFPIAIATDEKRPGSLFVISGIWDEKLPGKLSISEDHGEHFTHVDLPFRAHGNLNGRGTGSKLIVDKNNSDVLYYASQADGLWRSKDRGQKWEKLSAMKEDYLTLIAQTYDGSALIVGSAGITTKKSEGLRGHALYISYDRGESFEDLSAPAESETEGVKRAGHVPQRIAVCEKYVFVTLSVMGKNAYADEFGYSCDGGSAFDGILLRYEIGEDGRLGDYVDITPDNSGAGLAGLALSESRPGLVAVSSISKADGDSIYRSFDYGESWEEILHGLDKGVMDFRTSYMKPEHNEGGNLIHWLSDLKINPFDENDMWFNTGTGVFRTRNLTGETVVFSDSCKGLEETVHLNLYSPPFGDVILVDILGDLGGFAFKSLDETPRNSFDDADGNRYVTCLNADFSDTDPENCVITARGNWKGSTKGGLIRTRDGFETFERINMPFGLSEKLDESLHMIEQPNVNSGWVAMSVDLENIVWSVAVLAGITLPMDMVVVSNDGGESFSRVKVIALDGSEIELSGDEYRGLKVFSDRVEPDYFYGFDDHGHIFFSRDGGKTFKERREKLPDFDLARIDCADKSAVRAECGAVGVLYAALSEEGLWKIKYNDETDDFILKKLSRDGDVIYNIGLGLGREDGDYFTEPKAIYMNARIAGVYGFYRTFDDMATVERINDDSQMFGDINAIEGDSRVFGRFYIGSGSRGVLWGEEA